MVAGALVHAPTALAHTLGNRHVSQLFEIELGPDGVVLRLTVDAPPEQWAAYGGGADPIQGSLDRLHQGLMVIVDNATVPIRVTDARPIWDLASGANNLQVVAVADVDLRGHHTLRIGNANLSDTPNYLNDELTVPPGAVIHSTSLLRKTATGQLADRSGVWAQYEALRSVSIDATLPQDPVTLAFAAQRGGVWTLAQARERTAWEAWSTRQDTPMTVGLAALITALLAASGTRLASSRVAAGLAVILPSSIWVLFACELPFRAILLATWLVAAILGAISGRGANRAGPLVYGAALVGSVIAATRLIG